MDTSATMTVTQAQACEDIVGLLNKLKNAMLGIADELGVTRIQLFAIYSIDKSGQLPMGQFADVLHCDPSNVTGIVDRLVHQQLVVRQECSNDRRSKLLVLTPEGKKMAQTLGEALPGRMGLDSLAEEELDILHRLIAKICI